MSDSLYQYTDSENEMIDPMHASRTTDTSGRSRVDRPEEDAPTPPPPTQRRTPIPSPRKPARPASISVAQPLDSSSRDTSIQMDDISIPKQNFYEEVDIGPTRSNPLLSSTPVQQQDKPSIPQSQPDRSGSILPERAKPTSAQTLPDKTGSSPAPVLSKEEREKQKLKNMIKAADKPNAVTTNDGDDDFEKTFMQRHKRPIMIVVFLLLLALAIVLGIGARSASIVSYAEAFSQSKGMPCNHICTNSERYSTPPLIVIALNGFRSSFFEHKSVVSNMARLAECGVHGNTIPSYPSTAIPNLYSIVTGIHPAYHGKASDWLRIFGLNETQFGPADQPNTYSRMDPRWIQHNGLWGLAANEGLLTASHSWIGREGDIDEELPPSPSYYQTFDSDVDYKARMETVLNWLHLEPDLRPSFITVYYEDPGKTAKLHGFNSKVTMNSLARVDSAIGLLLDSLYEEQNLGCVNIMVVSTGGLAERHCNKVSYLSDDLQNLDDFSLLPDSVTSLGKITATDQSPLEMDSPEEIMEHLQCKVSHGKVFTKRLLPVRFHASYGLQSEDVMVLMEPGWTIAKQPEGYDRYNCKGASDGLDPYSHDMQGLFIGFGKDFQIGETIPTVRNVDLFYLMADLINVTAPTNNGTRSLVTMALKSPQMQETDAVEFSSPRNAECSYPSNDEYDQRQRDQNTGCECTQETLNSYSETKGDLLRDKDDNIRRTDAAASRQQNAPFGIPQVLSDVGPSGQDYCELYQNNFIAAFENKLKLPLFATFTVRRNSPTVTRINNCLRYDVRLQPEKTPKCSSYDPADNPRLPINIVQGFLYEPALANSIDNELNALTTANIVPQYASFRQNVWLPLADKIHQWANEGNRSADMNVLVGPVYDWDSDTRRDTYHQVASSQAWVTDTPVPSHYFVVATRCKQDVALSMCPIRSIEVVSFVLPHTNSVKMCKMFDDYMLTHLASLQDVELITGLHLFPDLNNEENSVETLLLLKTEICHHGWHGAERCE